MIRPNDLLFGQIAIEQGFVTDADVQECLAEQRRSTPPRPLGEILFDRGTITRRQMESIAAEQERRLAEEDPRTLQRREDKLFGRLAWRLGLITREDLNAAVRQQAQELQQGREAQIGEILIARSLLTDRQMLWVLEIQRKALLLCTQCRVLYSLRGMSGEEILDWLTSIRCQRCRGPLLESGQDIPEDVECVVLTLEEMPIKAVVDDAEEGVKPAAAPVAAEARPAEADPVDATPEPSAPSPRQPDSDPALPVPSGPQDCTCPLCDHGYQEAPDKYGRVRCPKCRTLALAG